MKKINYLLMLIAVLSFTVACNKTNYRKTKSGLLYKLYAANNKEPLIKTGQFVKFNVKGELNDSVLFTSYGKLPSYAQVSTSEQAPYNLLEILPLMKKGDSAVTVQLIDTLLKQGMQLPPNAKKGDRIVTTFRIIEVFATDSLAMKDYNVEMEKDKPRQMKEQEEQMAKMKKEMQEKQIQEDIELEKSGEIANEIKAMEAYLAAKNIKAEKTGKGTFVYIQQQGTGPQATAGKYVEVKYTGRILETDSVFQSNTYAFQLGMGNVIRGWDEGLLLFKQGGKGTLFIPGYLCYGKGQAGSPFKPFQAMKFEVEMLNVSDTPLTNQPQQ